MNKENEGVNIITDIINSGKQRKNSPSFSLFIY